MKKFYFLALAALVLSLAACGPKVIEKKFEKTNFATVTVEGSGKYGVKDVVSGREILPQSFDNIPPKNKSAPKKAISNLPKATPKAFISSRKRAPSPAFTTNLKLTPPATFLS